MILTVLSKNTNSKFYPFAAASGSNVLVGDNQFLSSDVLLKEHIRNSLGKLYLFRLVSEGILRDKGVAFFKKLDVFFKVAGTVKNNDTS